MSPSRSPALPAYLLRTLLWWHLALGGGPELPSVCVRVSWISQSVGATRQNLGATRQNLGATRQNLGATRQNLGATRQNLGATRQGGVPRYAIYAGKLSAP